MDGSHAPNGLFDMPVIWARLYGAGRVFYQPAGRHADTIAQPETLRLITRSAVGGTRGRVGCCVQGRLAVLFASPVSTVVEDGPSCGSRIEQGSQVCASVPARCRQSRVSVVVLNTDVCAGR